MRILLLSDAGSIHTYKWVRSLSELDNDIYLFSLSESNSQNYEALKNVKIFSCGYKAGIFMKNSSFLKFKYYLPSIKKLREIITEFSPDLLHAHYATSYGLLGALSGFHPYILSVWGSDVFSFPKKSFLHEILLRFNFMKSDSILSTSLVMKNEIEKYTNKNVNVIPFGVDTSHFKPKPAKQIFNENYFVIGTVKSLEEIYGIEYLIRAFRVLKDRYKGLPLKLLIIGDGSQKYSLQELCKSLNLSNDTIFTGYIPNEILPDYLNMIDAAVFPSLEESFGVSILEASACKIPVIASNIGGIPETVNNNCTGILVKPKEISNITNALEYLLLDKDKRKEMGENGRSYVTANFEWSNSVQKLIGIYEKSKGITKLN